MNDFAFAEGAFASLRADLLKRAPSEAAAILLCGHCNMPERHRLIAREQIVVPPDSCDAGPASVTIHPEFLARQLKLARNEGFSLIFAHSHPFSDTSVSFSVVDDHCENALMPSVFRRAANRPHGTLVLGQDNYDARLWTSATEATSSISRITEVGRNVRFFYRDGPPTSYDGEFHDRSVRALGREGQEALSRLNVGIVGLGGLGSIIAEQLAHLGIGGLSLIDHDLVERSNLNRVVGANESSIGRAKVHIAQELVRGINPNTRVDTCFGDVRQEHTARTLLSADVIFCCTDSHGSRAVLNQVAYQYFVPVIDSGVTIHAQTGAVKSINGRVQLLAPGEPCLVCHNLLDPEEVRRDLLSAEERERDPYIIGVHEPQPAVVSINGTVASLAVTMFLSITTGFRAPARHLVYLAHRGTVRSIQSVASPECVICSLKGALGRGDSWPMSWRRW